MHDKIKFTVVYGAKVLVWVLALEQVMWELQKGDSDLSVLQPTLVCCVPFIPVRINKTMVETVRREEFVKLFQYFVQYQVK